MFKWVTSNAIRKHKTVNRMHKLKIQSRLGATPLAIIALVGFVVAGATFLAAFITTQKASVPASYPKLKKITISPPPHPSMPPLKGIPSVEQPASPNPSSLPLSESDSPTTLQSELDTTVTTEATNDLNAINSDLNQL